MGPPGAWTDRGPAPDRSAGEAGYRAAGVGADLHRVPGEGRDRGIESSRAAHVALAVRRERADPHRAEGHRPRAGADRASPLPGRTLGARLPVQRAEDRAAEPVGPDAGAPDGSRR